jgi:hypothetical protein
MFPPGCARLYVTGKHRISVNDENDWNAARRLPGGKCFRRRECNYQVSAMRNKLGAKAGETI